MNDLFSSLLGSDESIEVLMRGQCRARAQQGAEEGVEGEEGVEDAVTGYGRSVRGCENTVDRDKANEKCSRQKQEAGDSCGSHRVLLRCVAWTMWVGG